MIRLPAAVMIQAIKAYRFLISPLLGRNCRFHPTCSEYAMEAIAQRGVVFGVYLGIRRLLKCHPWHPGGLDPVPLKKTTCNSHPQTEL